MEYNAAKFRDDMQTALDLLEAHGVSPAQFFVRQSTLDAIKVNLAECGYMEEQLNTYMNIDGIPCVVWVETLQ